MSKTKTQPISELFLPNIRHLAWSDKESRHLISLFGLLAEAMFRCVQSSKGGSIVSRDTFFDFISRMRIPVQTCHPFRWKAYHFSGHFRNRWESSASQQSQYDTGAALHHPNRLFLNNIRKSSMKIQRISRAISSESIGNTHLGNLDTFAAPSYLISTGRLVWSDKGP